jgi:hypothetical protein
MESSRHYELSELRAMMTQYGPLWCGEADPGLHVVVLAGMYGDGSDAGTWLRVNDPWPIGRGERYTLPFTTFADNFAAARDLGGLHVQLLHASGRGGTRTIRGERVVSWSRCAAILSKRRVCRRARIPIVVAGAGWSMQHLWADVRRLAPRSGHLARHDTCLNGGDGVS